MSTPDELYDEASKLKGQGRLEEAVAKLQQILKIAPDHVLAHSALGVHLQKLGQVDQAIRHAVRVTELEPGDPFSFTQLSVIYQRCGKIPEAEEAMARAHMLQGRPH
ncbi:MAG: tetratricopeptide repeat protein [Planctomycetaceae bacterium]